MSKARDLANAADVLDDVSATELGHLDGVTSAIQTQLDAKTAKSTLTTKGDIYAATAASTPARLAVGNSGDTLVADSAATTGLRWQGDYAAGKNKIINGDFGIWQRGTSFTVAGYTVDRFNMVTSVGEGTVSQQTFTPGTAPVAGYEAQYFLRYNATASNIDPRILQPIEDVRTFAGQTVTVSFWAKSDVSDAIQLIQLNQIFGSGGSTTVTTSATGPTLTSSWVRYSVTIAVPSISGKTIGTNSSLRLTIDLKNSTAFNFDIWGVQVEAGSVATAFQTATGTLQGELAACQRYYFRTATNTNARFGNGSALSTTQAEIGITMPVPLRVNATSIDFSNLSLWDTVTATSGTNCVLTQAGTTYNTVNITVASGLTQYRPYFGFATASGFLAFNAEL